MDSYHKLFTYKISGSLLAWEVWTISSIKVVSFCGKGFGRKFLWLKYFWEVVGFLLINVDCVNERSLLLTFLFNGYVPIVVFVSYF